MSGGPVLAAAAVVPLAVAAARVYRGMHHPSDVVAGLANGVAAVAVARRATLHGRRSEAT